jgi:excisionase family DNA binding protein
MTSKAAATDALARTGLAPRGLSREQAAAYVGVSATAFDELIRKGQMPHAKSAGGRKVWDVRALDIAFSALPDAGGTGGIGAGTRAGDDGDVWSRARV